MREQLPTTKLLQIRLLEHCSKFSVKPRHRAKLGMHFYRFPPQDISQTAVPTLRPESRLIMRNGVDGGMITQSEYLIALVTA